VLALAFTIWGCSNYNSSASPFCPNVSILGGSESLVLFKDGPGRDIIDILAELEMSSLQAKCEYDDLRVNVQTSFEIIAVQGLKSDIESAIIGFFVAVVGPNGQMLAKENFESQIEFPHGRRQIGVSEEMVQRIPLSTQNQGPNYQVLVGFQLTPEQLAYNQSRRP